MRRFVMASLLGLLLVLVGGCELFERPFSGSLAPGDTGPAGGIIIFVDFARRHPFDYIEVAPADIGSGSSEYPWGLNVAVTGTGTGIGTGAANTDRIISVQDAESNTLPSYAAGMAAAFTSGGFDDWYLPSRDELNLIHELRESVPGLRANQYYWSSSDDDSEVARVWAQMVNDSTGRQASTSSSGKLTTFSVRAVRSFRESDL